MKRMNLGLYYKNGGKTVMPFHDSLETGNFQLHIPNYFVKTCSSPSQTLFYFLLLCLHSWMSKHSEAVKNFNSYFSQMFTEHQHQKMRDPICYGLFVI